MDLLDGKAIAASIRAELADTGRRFAEHTGRKARLELILVGDDPASGAYVRSKCAQAARSEIEANPNLFPASVDPDILFRLIHDFNDREDVDGILVQLPLPPSLNPDRLIESVAPEKDVDGFTSINAGLWLRGDARAHTPCTPSGCLYLLRHTFGFGQLAGRRAVIVGRSMIVGKPMAALLLGADCTVTILHSKTRNAPSLAREAEILVVAAGRPGLVDKEWIGDGACVIDVGIHRRPDGSLCGDVNPENANMRTLTPVPGGVGPMTIAYLLYNTLRSALRRTGLEATISLPEALAPL